MQGLSLISNYSWGGNLLFIKNRIRIAEVFAGLHANGD